jgi:predicted permease
VHDLFRIFTHIVFPVLLIAAAGYLVQKKFKFELLALTKTFFFVISPCLVFTRVYETALSWESYGLYALFTGSLIALMGVIGLVVSRAARFSVSMRAAFMLSVMMANTGNYGLPVIELMFNGDPFATSVQLIVMVSQGLIHYTFGVFLVASGQGTFREAVGHTFRYPLIYAVALVFVFKGFSIPVWEPVWFTMEKISAAFVPLALFTLGAQLARIRLGRGVGRVLFSSAFRLLVSPIVAIGLIRIFGFTGIVAQILFVGSAFPTAVNSALFAEEFKNEPEFASQAVFFSTLLSFFTVSLAIWIARIWIG